MIYGPASIGLANPAGLWALLLALPILLLHVLRPRRPEAVVPSVFLWRGAEQSVSSARPWQRLRPSALLFVQLLAVTLLALALARPTRSTAAPLRAHTVFVIDTSGSMAATDGAPDRLSSAKREAKRLRGELPSGGIASIVTASIDPQVVLTASSDRGAFDAALARISVTGGGAHWQDTFNLAASLETPGKPLGIVAISDGHLDTDEQRAIPAGSSYVKVGARSTNRAIVSLTVEAAARGTGGGLRAHVTVRSTGGARARQVLRIDVDGRARAKATVTVPAKGSVDRSFDVPQGDRVEAFLEGDDLLAADNRAFAVGTRNRSLRVLVAGAEDAFLDRVLASLPGVTVERTDVARPAPGFDLVVYDGVAVPASPGAPFLAIAPPGGTPEVRPTGVVRQPSLTVIGDDAVLSGLDLTDVGIASAQSITAPDSSVLVGAEETPLIVRGLHDQYPYAYIGFSLADSNLPLQVAFPLLIDRLVHDLAGGGSAGLSVIVGQPLPVDAAQDLVLVRPRGGVLRHTAGGAAPTADQVGFWSIRQPGRPAQVVAVNPDTKESALAPADRLLIAKRPAVPGQSVPAGQRPLLPIAVAIILAVLLVEWLLARRRIGVSRRQWRIGALLRVAIVACLIGALANLTISRRDGRVAVLFAIDGSDSLGTDGRAAALQLVRDALDEKPSAARAGVVIFGGDARVDSLVQKETVLDEPSVQIDRARTNAAGALRLAPAVLPPSAKRRVVLVSDGRFTDGDVAAEARRLREQGIPVDVQVVSPPRGSDVAVRAVDVPGRVALGDAYNVRAVIAAEGPTTVKVHVRRDDGSGREREVVTRTVELRAGDNIVDVPERADRSGVGRYRVVVDAPGDTREENNTAFGATEVSGPARVLIVSGTPGEADALTDALTASGVQSDTVEASALPPLDRLAGYRAIVLVDVDARSLVAEQITALRAATRDLGRGLVVLGGAQSYGLGGYQRSPLEELLPVESDVRDPLRRKKIAEVLAIDTSGSMGACHCPGGRNGIVGGGNRAEGGVSKTDISRAAAAKSISALAAGDQVGVLAFNSQHRWVIDLAEVPAQSIVDAGLASLTPRGNTNLTTPLLDAGDKLRRTRADLKHIILMTDGFTSPEALAGLAAQARQLAEEGITVSVVATGEGAANELGLVAQSGRGRFYPGTDLLEIPEIVQQETVVASRSFVNEGVFTPRITANAAPVRELTAAPPLLGFIATTPKATAQTWMRIGPDDDPLLASWRVGLGRVTAWTSDASMRWSQQWATWSGYGAFWAAVVKDAFPLDQGATARAEVRGDRLRVTVEGAGSFPEGATARAHIGGPAGNGTDVLLERAGAGTFVADVDAPLAGTYAIGATISRQDGTAITSASGLATRSYAAEYEPGGADRRAMLAVSQRAGGRGSIASRDAFSPSGLRAGSRHHRLSGWLLLLACLLWPIDVAVRRLARRRSGAAGQPGRMVAGERALAAFRALRSKTAIDSGMSAPTAAAPRIAEPSSPGPTSASQTSAARTTARQPGAVPTTAVPTTAVRTRTTRSGAVPVARAAAMRHSTASAAPRSPSAPRAKRPARHRGSAPASGVATLDRLLEAKREKQGDSD